MMKSKRIFLVVIGFVVAMVGIWGVYNFIPEASASKENSNGVSVKKVFSYEESNKWYWIPFESGDLNEKATSVVTQGTCEVSIGIFNWTTTENLNRVQEFFKGLKAYNKEYDNEFSSWSNTEVLNDIYSQDSKIKKVIKKFDEKNHEQFIKAQIYVYETEVNEVLKTNQLTWVATKGEILQGTVYSVLGYAPYAVNWNEYLDPEVSDCNNLWRLYVAVQSINSPMKQYAQKRWFEQFNLAFELEAKNH